MRIAKISIKNILGIDEAEIQAGQTVNLIEGKNGAGKTSVLEAIKAVLGTGSDATLLRNGASSGEAVLILDDGSRLTAKVDGKGRVTRSVTGPNGEKSTQPATDIRAIADMISINPVEFINNPKARMEIIIQALNYQVDPDEIEQLFGVSGASGGVEVLDSIRKTIYDNRTHINRSIKEKKATIGQIAATLPENFSSPHVVEGEIAFKRKQFDELSAQASEQSRAIDAEFSQRIAELKAIVGNADRQVAELTRSLMADLDAKKLEAKNTADELIASSRNEYSNIRLASSEAMSIELQRLKSEYEAACSAVREKHDKTMSECSASESKYIAGVMDAFNRQISEESAEITARIQAGKDKIYHDSRHFTEELATAESQRQTMLADVQAKAIEVRALLNGELDVLNQEYKQAIQNESIQKSIDDLHSQVSKLSEEADVANAMIETVDQMKADIFRRIPIQGIEIQDGKLLVDGVDFDRLNTARQVEIAMQVALIRRSALRAICVDGIECLDSESMYRVSEWAKNNDAQLFVTRVTDNAGVSVSKE